MTREDAQALVEVVLAVPACIACALAIADCGVLVRDRVAVAQAAGRAAEARLVGDDVEAAARGALPASMRDDVHVEVRGDRVVVRATGGARIAELVGRPVVHQSSVEVAR